MSDDTGTTAEPDDEDPYAPTFCERHPWSDPFCPVCQSMPEADLPQDEE